MLDDPFNIDDLHEEDLITIDLDAINSDSEKEAKDIIKIVTDLYQDDRFKERHPQVQRRIELELETLRGLIKMRKADEEAHDALILAITENKNNASLYRAMSEIQKTSIQLTNKIHDTIEKLNTICKGFQLELEFDGPEQDDEDMPETRAAHRGSKSFIKDMLESSEKNRACSINT